MPEPVQPSQRVHALFQRNARQYWGLLVIQTPFSYKFLSLNSEEGRNERDRTVRRHDGHDTLFPLPTTCPNLYGLLQRLNTFSRVSKPLVPGSWPFLELLSVPRPTISDPIRNSPSFSSSLLSLPGRHTRTPETSLCRIPPTE